MPKITVFRNVRIFDGEKVISDNGQVVICDNKIQSVDVRFTPSSFDEASATVISAEGHTLLPGLIDCHVHCYNLPIVQERSIKWGITTVLGLHSLGLNRVIK